MSFSLPGVRAIAKNAAAENPSTWGLFQHPRTFEHRCIASSDGCANRPQRDAVPFRQLSQLRQRQLDISMDIVAQRFQWRDINCCLTVGLESPCPPSSCNRPSSSIQAATCIGFTTARPGSRLPSHQSAKRQAAF